MNTLSVFCRIILEKKKQKQIKRKNEETESGGDEEDGGGRQKEKEKIVPVFLLIPRIGCKVPGGSGVVKRKTGKSKEGEVKR